MLAGDPEKAEALIYKGVIEIESKTYAAAIDPLDRVLKQPPSNANALRNRALAYLQLGDLDKAEKDYDTMRRLMNRDLVYVAYYGLGEIADRHHDAPTARKFYNLYLQAVPRQDSPELKEEIKKVSDRLNELKR